MRRYTTALASLSLIFLGTSASAQEYWAGRYTCEEGPVLAHLTVSPDGGAGFRIVREDRRSGRKYLAHTYAGDLVQGLHDGLGNRDWDVIIHELGSDTIEAEWLDRRSNEKPECDRFTLRPQAEPLEVYSAVRDLAAVDRPIPADARILAEAAALLPPSGLLPQLDQQTVPRETHEVQAAFWNRYLEEIAERIEAAPLDTQADAEALAGLTRAAFPWTVAPARTIFEDFGYTAAVDEVLTRAGARILETGLAVPVLIDLSGDAFCTAAVTMPLGLDRWDLLAGLPYRAWDRDVAEDTLARLSDCPTLGAVQADRLARDWPRIQEAAAREEAQAEAARAAAGARAELEAILAEAMALEPTVENYLATGGFTPADIDLDPTDREAADSLAAYRLRMQTLRTQAQSAVASWFAEQVVVSDADLLADDWNASSLALERCGIAIPEGIEDPMLPLTVGQACTIAIRAFEDRRDDLRCTASLDGWQAPDQLDLTLRIGTGSTALDMQDTSLRDFLCNFGAENDITLEETGFFSTGYELTVTSSARPESATTASFEVSDAGDLVPTEVEHSLGGDLSGLDAQARMRCLMRPTQRFCEAPPE